nr:hypothetical protein [Kibdelosporangium sp. MJ126-NF4]
MTSASGRIYGMTVITPPRVQRSPLRLIAGLLWLVAAGLGVGSTFADVLHRSYDQDFRLETGYWETRSAPAEAEATVQTTYYGIPVILAAVLMVLAFLVVLLTTRRWGAIVAGAFGTGVLLDSALTWYLGLATTGTAEDDRSQTELKAGLILVTVAAVVALFALLLALLERTRPVYAPVPHYGPPPMRPLRPPPPRWEPETPSYGVPIHTERGPEQPETPSYGTPVQSENATAQPQSVPDTPSDTTTASDTTAIEPPPAPEPGSISRKLDGDEK